MYNTVTRNLRKRKKLAETWYLETTTMFAPGAESVAEGTYKLGGLIRRTRKRRSRAGTCGTGCCWITAGANAKTCRRDSLRAAIAEAFGEAIEWNDVEAIVDEFYDVRKDTNDSRRYFLNAVTGAADAWLAEHEIAGFSDATKSWSPTGPGSRSGSTVHGTAPAASPTRRR
jgi:hypothetical protein